MKYVTDLHTNVHLPTDKMLNIGDQIFTNSFYIFTFLYGIMIHCFPKNHTYHSYYFKYYLKTKMHSEVVISELLHIKHCYTAIKETNFFEVLSF